MPMHTRPSGESRGLVRRFRRRSSVRLLKPRRRRALARRLREVAARTPDRDPLLRRHDYLLHERVATVRAELLEIAALLEHSQVTS